MRVAAAAVVATAAGLVVTATPAFAACGNLCDGKNPQTFTYLDRSVGGPGATVNCSTDVRTPADTSTKKFKVYTTDHPSAPYIELRYSPTCRTAWARTSAVNWTIYVESYNTDGTLRKTAEQHTNSNVKYTAMVNDAGLTARACISVPVSDRNVCTARY